MNKRFTFMKSMITLVVILLAAFTLVACGGEDQQALVDEAKAQVALVFASGDSATSVTQDLTLPTTVGDVQITWASGNTAVISNAGVVVRQTADTNVTLTATLTLGDATATKAFALKVIAAVVVIDPLDALDDIMITGYGVVYTASTDRYTTILNINLVTSSMGLPVTWSSSNEAVISTAGVVVRPAWSTADSTVILTATIGTETKDFVVTALAITEKPVSLILSEAKDVLLLSDVGDGVAANLTLPATVGNEGVTVTWTSGNTDYISDAGVVTRPSDGNVTVTLTATLHLGDATETKDFEVIVLAFEPYTAAADIAAAIALQVAADANVYVEIPDLTIVGVWTTGYMVYDGTTLMQVYKVPTAEIVEGAVFTVRGIMTNYFGALEIIGNANMPLVLTASEAAAEVLNPTVVTSSVSDYIATLPAYPLTSPLSYQYVQITAKVQVDDPSDKYETFLVNTTHDGSDINVKTAANFTTNAFMIYYPSNLDAVRAYDGLEVTLNIFIFGVRTDKLIYYVLYTSEAEDVQTTLDDAGIVGVAKTALTASFDAEYTVESTIDLPASMLGTSIVWDTASEYVNLTTGLVTMPATPGQVDVTLTGTITRGDATDTVTITFKVGELEIMTIAAARAVAVDSLVRIQGIISGYSISDQYGNAAVFIQDATGGMFIYRLGASFTSSLAIGTEVDVIGTRAAYRGLEQVASVTQFNVVSTGNTVTPVVVDANTVLMDVQGQLATISGYLSMDYTLSGTGNLNFNFVNEFGTFTAVIVGLSDSSAAQRDPIIAAINGAAVATLVTVVAPIDWKDSALFRIYQLDQITLGAVGTSVELSDLIVANTMIPVADAQVVADLDLPLVGILGSTVTWVSDVPATIANDGTVVRPAYGEADVVVTLTYEIKLGETVLATDSVVFTVLAETEMPAAPAPDLIISEYIEGTPGNRKAIELFNPTSETIVLTDVYTLALNVNANDYWATAITLEGSIAAGETFVVYYDDSPLNDMLGTFGDSEKTSLSFNGDDAVGLFKDGVLLDLFGVFGEDPGSGWTMATIADATKDHVITRNASILIPSNVWKIEEWVVGAAYVDGTVTTLGVHTAIVATELFISEYVEGSSNGSNRAIEIYNGTGVSVDLTGYTLELYKGGSATVSESFTLTGTLAHGQVFILTNTAADQAIIDLANDAVDYPGVPFFTGDDAITLSKDGSVIDMFGIVGEDPGDFWVVGTGSTQNYTLVRKIGVLSPVGTWDVNEWDVYPSDTITYLGSHKLA